MYLKKSVFVLTFLLSAFSYDFSKALNLEYQRCVRATNVYEKLYKLPPGLLYSITILESGKWNKYQKKILPYPWTFHLQGKAYYFSTKKEAVNFLNETLDKGIENIDIGCAQINWKYHGKHHFKNPEDILNPNFNVAYAAYFLAQNYAKTRDWNKAVAIYHSRTQKGLNYLKKVKNIWNSHKKDEKSKTQSIDTNAKKKNMENTVIALNQEVKEKYFPSNNKIRKRNKKREKESILVFSTSK